MKKLMNVLLLAFMTIFCLLNSSGVFAKAVLNIVPSALIVNLSAIGTASITYTVTNDTKHPINHFTIYPAYHTAGNPAGIGLQNNNCAAATLAPNQSCSFQAVLSGTAQPSRFILRPRVCGYTGAVCSVPTANNEVQVVVSPTVTNVVPSGAVRATTSEIVITFSESMNPATISSATVNLVRNHTTTNIISACAPSANNTVFTCSFNTNLISNHVYDLTVSTGAQSALGDSLAAPYQTSFSTLARFVYVTNYANSTLSLCPINVDGSLGICTASDPGASFVNPAGIAINPVGTFAYVTNFNGNSVSICPLNMDGTIGVACTIATDSTFNGPAGIAVNPANTTLYVVNYYGDSISVCPINPNGSLGTCSAPPMSFQNPDCVVINRTATFAYVTNSTGASVSMCSVNPNGSLSTCINMPDPTFFGPAGFAFDSGDRFGYVANGALNHQTVSQCPVNADGTLGACTALDSATFNGNNFGKIALDNRISYAYVANETNNWLSVCPVNPDGSFGVCVASNPGATFHSPEGVAVH